MTRQSSMTLTRTIAILIPCYNESECVSKLFAALKTVCNGLTSYRWHLIFVDDGSTDGTATLLDQHLMDNDAWCSGIIIRLSRNFGKEAALIAGLDYCDRDACIIMDADLQDPPDLIPQIVSRWEAGANIVSAKRIDRSSDNRIKRITASLFYRTFKRTSKLNIEIDASDFRLIDKSVIKAIRECRESIRFSKGFFAWAGFTTAYVSFKRPTRQAGQTKWGSWKLWNYALDGIFSFSTAPLRIWTYCGTIITILSFSLAARVIVTALVKGTSVPGYASLFTAVTLLGGIQLLGIGIIGEYLGRTYIESKRRPLYVVKDILEFRLEAKGD